MDWIVSMIFAVAVFIAFRWAGKGFLKYAREEEKRFGRILLVAAPITISKKKGE